VKALIVTGRSKEQENQRYRAGLGGFLGATELGGAVKFIPRPVVVGFTNGIAVIIASTQIKDFFGLKFERGPVSCKKNWPCRPARIDGVRMRSGVL